jgi:ubiquinone/menaquinone biosynthesis C-methylase UbiE
VHYGPLSPGETELQLLGPVANKDVLEVGCGGGQNAVVLAKWGARSAGLDISEEQLRHARRLAKQHGVHVTFHVGDMENMDRLSAQSFDVVLSSCAIGYSAKPAETFKEAFRVLRENGRFVFCVVHPIVNRGRPLNYGGRRFWGIGNYFDRRRRRWTWKFDKASATFVGHHRTLQDYFNQLVAAGFIVERILEPEPYPLKKMTEDEKQKIPYYWKGAEKEYDVWRRIPYTIIFKARKPTHPF